jgi:hypothetical protein
MLWSQFHASCSINSKYGRKCNSVLNIILIIFSLAVDPIFPPPDISKFSGGKKDFIPENVL